MGREREAFRSNMERINTLIPNREMLRIVDVMMITGRCRNTVRKRYPFDANREISKADLARLMSLKAR